MRTTLLFLMITLHGFAQVKLNDTDFNNLLAISKLYTENVNAKGKEFDKSLNELRTPKLNHIVDVLSILDEEDKKMFSPKYLNRPNDEELQLWYVIRQIHYNHQADNKNPKSDNEVAHEVLNSKIDTRWLLDNYYFQVGSGIATLFNDKNLSKINFDIDSYQLKNTTEKAIFFFNISRPLVQRFQVLSFVKNYDKLLEFAAKLPSFNNKPYYAYTALDYADFDWIGYDKPETYNERHITEFYGYIMAHFSALAQKNKKEEANDVYFGSILFKPEYFKYSDAEALLKDLYEKKK